jgi:hypothetical protein
MAQTKKEHQDEVRYSVILCNRTARLYRRAQTAGVFIAVLGGSGLVATQSADLRNIAAAIVSIAGAALLAVKPAEKATANEADARRYGDLLAGSHNMTPEQLEQALHEHRSVDTQEVAPIRSVAYNQLMAENGRLDCLLKLSFGQRIIAWLA